MQGSCKYEKLLSGNHAPMGAHWDGDGTNFALFSAHAERVELCLFSSDGMTEIARLDLNDKHNQVWHGYLPGAGPGTIYAYRVHGPYQPQIGHRFNPHKLLLDPYCRQLTGRYVGSELHHGFDSKHTGDEEIADKRDNADFMPKCVVTAPSGGDSRRRHRIPMADTLFYETHVKGFTMLHPGVPDEMRGRLPGLAHKDVIAYIKSLGVTSVELMPVQSFISEPFLLHKNLGNYWGYNPLCFFAPHQSYLSNESNILEMRELVDLYHDAGLEVIMDVVFNHTAEGGRLGPTLSFRGIDNLSYYRLQNEDRSFYINDTGCGNTLNLVHPRVIQMVMDCLRYWTETMQVDGFRFDLAPVLGRETYGFDKGSGFFDALLQDPVLAGSKMIAEPWDIGPGGYQLGNFPPGWHEWNDRYRDTVRRYWRGDPGVLPEFARRLHGSSDIFEHSGRRPSSSVNYVASHDGFTLNDLVSYCDRHNEANGEKNQDGHRENYSDNFGTEGPVTDATVHVIRLRQQRNFLTTLMWSQGTPLLQAGDEFCRTLHGNNNAYCQDNVLSWIDWQKINSDGFNQQAFTRHLIALRKKYRCVFPDRYIHESTQEVAQSIHWYSLQGEEMQATHWQQHQLRTLGCLMSAIDPDSGRYCQLMVIFHADRSAIRFTLPVLENIERWEMLLDTATLQGKPDSENCFINRRVDMFSCSTAILLAHHNASNQE
jgi:isoamylase